MAYFSKYNADVSTVYNIKILQILLQYLFVLSLDSEENKA